MSENKEGDKLVKSDNKIALYHFIGVDGIDPSYGLTTTNLLEASLNRAMMQAAQKTIVLTDSSKFGRRGFGKICGLEAIDQIITDDKVSPLVVKDLEERGIEITLVPQSAP